MICAIVAGKYLPSMLSEKILTKRNSSGYPFCLAIAVSRMLTLGIAVVVIMLDTSFQNVPLAAFVDTANVWPTDRVTIQFSAPLSNVSFRCTHPVRWYLLNVTVGTVCVHFDIERPGKHMM